MNSILTGRTIETQVCYLDTGEATFRFARFKVPEGLQTGSTEGQLTARILNMESAIEGLRREYATIKKQEPPNADTVLAAIEERALASVRGADRLRALWDADLDSWNAGGLTNRQMIVRWAGHTKLGLINRKYRTLELDTGNVVYCQFGSFDELPIDIGGVRVKKHEVVHRLG